MLIFFQGTKEAKQIAMDEKRTAGILVPEWRSSFPSDPPINNNYEVCGGRGSQAWRRLGEDLCKGNEAQPSE